MTYIIQCARLPSNGRNTFPFFVSPLLLQDTVELKIHVTGTARPPRSNVRGIFSFYSVGFYFILSANMGKDV